MKNTGICSLISCFGGVLVGSVAAMLTTPQSGAELRSKIRDYVDQEAEKIRCHCNDKQ
jgi:gas vesicle protein